MRNRAGRNFIGVSSDASRARERILCKALDQRIVPCGMCGGRPQNSPRDGSTQL